MDRISLCCLLLGLRMKILSLLHFVGNSLFVCLLIWVVGGIGTSAQANVTPARKVVVEISKDQEKVHWKKLWDDAREFARQGNLEQASKYYHDLLQLKPNIEEANWEYCKVLLEMSSWQDAGVLLETLVEIDPNRIDYLFSAGRVALEKANYLQAVKYYGQVYEMEPIGAISTKALEGLIAGLEGLGKKNNAFLLMEQMYQRKHSDPELLQKLAALSNELGMVEKAKYYYKELISKHSVDKETLFQAALLYENSEGGLGSVYYWERYLEFQPFYLPFRKKAADYYIETGELSHALPHLLVLYETRETDDETLLLLGKIYHQEEQRPDKALFYFEKYQEKFPFDQRNNKAVAQIQIVLANDFLSIVENDGALRLWRDLASITSNRKPIYLAMADLLDRLKKEDELIEVLEIIHKDDPHDDRVTLRIVEIFRQKKEYKKALHYLYLQDAENLKPADLLTMAELHLELAEPNKALRGYLKFLEIKPGVQRIRIKCLRLAGQLGLIKDLGAAHGPSGKSYSDESSFSELDKLYLNGLLAGGLFKKADDFYGKLLHEIDPKSTAGRQILFHKVEGLQRYGLVYEAEQIARKILAENVETEKALEKLTELAIQDQRLPWANSWFYLLLEENRDIAPVGEFWKWPENIFYLKIKLLEAEGEYSDAVELVKRYMIEGGENGNKGSEKRRKARMALIRLHYNFGEFDECKRMVDSFLKKYTSTQELAVIVRQLEQIGLNDGTEISTGSEGERIDSPGEALDRAVVEYEYDALEGAMTNVEYALKRIPFSVRARFLQARIYTAVGKYFEALKIIREMHTKFPDEDYLELLALKIEYRRGNFKQIVKELPLIDAKAEASTFEKKESHDESYYFSKRLILARSLWADKQWEASIKIYNSLLDTPVNTLFLEKMEVGKVNFNLPPLKKSFWNMVTFTNPEQPDPVATVMRPAFVGKNIGKPIDHISAGLYEKYRWQKLIERELFVREAMKRRNYYEVEKEYRASLRRGGAKDTLFDLAEVYGRMGLYGKEAELYEQISKEGPKYPELRELVRLNNLKRKPRVSASYRYSTEEGRGGYIDMKKKSWGVEGWVMPTLLQEMNLSYYRNHYQSNDGEENVWSNRWYGSYTSNFEDKVDLNMSFGVEDVSEDGDYSILYNIEFLGRIDDLVQGHVSFSQDIADDTVKAVEDKIYFQSLEGGLTFDLVPRWFCGFDYRHREYNDDNRQDFLRLWTSYNLYGESNLLRIKYAWENLGNSQENLARTIGLGRGFEQYDPPYWSPSTYWHHRMMVHFKHTFSHGDQEEKMLSHYTVDYSLGYESGNNVTQDAAFHIFLEMNRHFLLKGNFTYGSAADYDEVDVGMSFLYRW